MKKIIMALMATVAITLGVNAQTAQDTATKKTGTRIIQIKTSAVCDMCKETLEKAMAYEKGVKESQLDISSKIINVKYDPKKTSPEKIRKAITMAGYDADDMPADARAYENLNQCCKKDAKH